MIKVEPLPDEPALAHLRRWMHVGGYRTEEEIGCAMLGKHPRTSDSPKNTSMLMHTAHASGLSADHYAKQHSLLAVLRLAAPHGQDFRYGDSSADEENATDGFHMPRKGGYACRSCIDGDLKSRPTSWFRRTHQLIGLDWCPVHRLPLVKALADRPFDLLPNVLREEGRLSDAVTDIELPTAGFVRRFVDISVGLLGRERPAPCALLHAVLRHRAISLGVDGTGHEGHRLLSDLVVDLAEERWLLRHVPQFHHKFGGRQFRRIDKILSHAETPAEGDSYVLGLAALYDSAAEALAAVNGCDTKARTREHR